MSNTEATIVVSLILASTIFAIYLSVGVIKSSHSKLLKLFFICLLIIPVVGPFFFIWINSWPSRAPKHLDGHGASIGRRYIDETSSWSAPNLSFYKKQERDLDEANAFEQEKAERKMRRKARWEKVFKRKKQQSEKTSDNK